VALISYQTKPKTIILSFTSMLFYLFFFLARRALYDQRAL
jgi:hypothetical protein